MPSRHFFSLFAAFVFLVFSQTLSAKITIQVNLGGDLSIPDGTVGVLVADRSSNGFLSPAHSSAVGTKLEAGEQIGLSDDLIIGVVQSSTSEFTGGSGFVGVLRGIDYADFQLQPGMLMSFYWFPGITTPGASLSDTSTFETFTTPNASNLASSINFVLPAARGVFDLGYLDAANGGNISVGNPGANGTHTNGTAGVDDSVLPGGGGSPLDPSGSLPADPNLADIDWTDQAKGRYQGLVNGEGLRILGEITVSISTGGRLSVQIATVDGSYRYSGVLTAAGDVVNAVIPRRNDTDLILNLALREDATTGTYTLIGSLNDDGVISTIEATQNAFQRARVKAPEAGKYTIALPAPGSTTQMALPAGDGVGQVTVGTNGSVRASMVLGDGTRASDSGNLSEDGIWHLFTQLYARKGFLAGKVTFRDQQNVTDFDGPLHWLKPEETRPTSRSFYPSGFETTVNVVGSAYVRPRTGAMMVAQFVDAANNVQLDLMGGALDPAFTAKTLTWSTSNRVTFPAPATGESLRVSATSSTGAVSGSYQKRYLDGNGRTVTQRVRFAGVALQKQGVITGNFQGNEQTSGLLTIQSAGAPTLVVRDVGGGVLANGGTLDFGSIGVDGGVGERVVELFNNGLGTLYLPDYPVLSDPDFGLAAAAAGYIAPGESTRMRVRFRTSALGVHAATLTILSNDRTANPFILNLTAQGVAGLASDLDPGTSRNHADVPGSSAAEPVFSNAAFDDVNSIGNFGGSLMNQDTIGAVGGTASFRVSSRFGQGSVSGSVILASARGTVSGSINPDGSFVVTRFTGTLPRTHTLSNLQLVQSGAGDYAITGQLTRISDGLTLDLLSNHQTYSRSNPTAAEGKYTLVIPANEDLGSGYPSGDSIATLSIRSDGSVSAIGLMADGQRVSLRGRVNNDDTWNIYHKWREGELGGSVVFRDVPDVSDFDGTVRWTRPVNSRARIFHEGFAWEGNLLGSLYVAPRSGARVISQLPDGDDNGQLNIGDASPVVGARNFTWADRNRIAVTGLVNERVSLRVISSSGAMSGSFADQYVDGGRTVRRNIRFNAVVFQKQGIGTGNWGRRREIRLRTCVSSVGTPTLALADSGGAAIANGAISGSRLGRN